VEQNRKESSIKPRELEAWGKEKPIPPSKLPGGHGGGKSTWEKWRIMTSSDADRPVREKGVGLGKEGAVTAHEARSSKQKFLLEFGISLNYETEEPAL